MIEWNTFLTVAVVGLLLWTIWSSATVDALGDRLGDLRKDLDSDLDKIRELYELELGHVRRIREIRELLGPVWKDKDGNKRPVRLMATSHIRNCLDGKFVKDKDTRDAMWQELAYRKEAAEWGRKLQVEESPYKYAGDLTRATEAFAARKMTTVLGQQKGLAEEFAKCIEPKGTTKAEDAEAKVRSIFAHLNIVQAHAAHLSPERWADVKKNLNVIRAILSPETEL